MREHSSSINCPVCQRLLRPLVLGCAACGVRVEGPFQLNEFASLTPDELHLLRIFVMSEGRVRDMEAPLGLSYPTIRSRLSALREKIAATVQTSASAAVSTPVQNAAAAQRATAPDATVNGVLDQLQREELSFDEAMRRIRALRAAQQPPTSKRGKPGKA